MSHHRNIKSVSLVFFHLFDFFLCVSERRKQKQSEIITFLIFLSDLFSFLHIPNENTFFLLFKENTPDFGVDFMV